MPRMSDDHYLDRAAKCRERASKCRALAETAVEPVDREAWLQLADDWLKLAGWPSLTNGRSAGLSSIG
jgi:hypothetical protein